jgi:hypothetical protein
VTTLAYTTYGAASIYVNRNMVEKCVEVDASLRILHKVCALAVPSGHGRITSS